MDLMKKVELALDEMEKTLSPWQQENLEAMMWMFSDQNRGEGRTHLLAFVLLKIAVSNPGTWIRASDHCVTVGYSKALQSMILDMISKIGVSKSFKFNGDRFMFCSPTKE